MITVNAVVKRFESTIAVDDVTLELPTTGITSIIGPNGAGKSTLLSVISRITGADAGVVLIDGADVHGSPSREIAKMMSVLRQDPHTQARLTVRELVEFGRFPHTRGRLSPACVAAVDDALAYCDLGQLEQRPLHELSGGQRQRAYIAMVLAQDTRYLLLDEPLNNLDMVHATALMHLLRRLVEERGKSVVMVLHDINYASVHSDRIIAMRSGAVVQDGPPSAVVTPEALEAIYGMRFDVHEVNGTRFAAYYR